MLTIRLDSWDYALNQNEICEQIFCEFGIVNIALEVPSERERIQARNNMNNSFDFSEFYIAVNGKKIYDGNNWRNNEIRSDKKCAIHRRNAKIYC